MIISLQSFPFPLNRLEWISLVVLDLIKKISKQLTHRGPDGEGFFFDEDRVTLLNRRLAIIDRKGGDQPIFNEDGSIVVVYNGEIYNYRELRQKLQSNGHIFKTDSDTEVIVHAYELWGKKCFDKFNGMFAISLYDLKKDKLVLVRDHFGIKPLYFSIIRNNLIDSVTRDTSLLRGSAGKTAIRFSESHLTRDTYFAFSWNKFFFFIDSIKHFYS